MKITETVSALRNDLAAQRVVRQRNRRLEQELASFTSPAERLELDAILSRHTEEEIAELESMLRKPLFNR